MARNRPVGHASPVPPRRRYAAPKEAWHAMCTGAGSTGARVWGWAGTQIEHTQHTTRILRTQPEQVFITIHEKLSLQAEECGQTRDPLRDDFLSQKVASKDTILEAHLSADVSRLQPYTRLHVSDLHAHTCMLHAKHTCTQNKRAHAWFAHTNTRQVLLALFA